jgi:PKD domain-containing protein
MSSKHRRGREVAGAPISSSLSRISLIVLAAVGSLALASTPALADTPDQHFVGTLTATEHTVWHHANGVHEDGSRDNTASATVDLQVPAGSATVSSFTASNVSLSGTMDLEEDIGSSTCHIVKTADLDPGGSFTLSGSLGNLSTSWPKHDHQIDTGQCAGEPQGTNDFFNTLDVNCQTADDGSTGSVTYNYSYVTHGTFADSTWTCKGTLTSAGQIHPRFAWKDISCASPTGCDSNETYTLDAGGSTADAGIMTYTWLFEDGTSETGQVVTHAFGAFPDTHAHVVTLLITDNDGTTKFLSASVQPCAGDTGSLSLGNGCAIVPRFTWHDTPCSTTCPADDTYTLDGGLSTATVGIKSWHSTFDDGITADGQVVSHAWPDREQHFVTLHVTDNVGETMDISATVLPCSGDTGAATAGQGCTVKPRFTWKFTSCGSCKLYAGYELDASSSVATAGIKSWKWTFNDGATASGQTTIRRWKDTAPHQVTLEITDNNGATSSVSANGLSLKGKNGSRTVNGHASLHLGDTLLVGAGMTGSITLDAPKGVSPNTQLIYIKPVAGTQLTALLQAKGNNTIVTLNP